MDKKTEALKLALKKAFDLGKRYWQQADSEYTSQWKKADVTLASFNQLIENTIREALAEQPAKEKAPQSANCEAPGWISSDRARGDDCTTEQQYPDNFIEALMYDVAKRDSEALAEQPAHQEPVAWMHPDGRIWTFGRGLDKSTFTIPLYTTPPQRKPWVSLTEEERADCWNEQDDYPQFAAAIEAKLKEKNHG